MNITYKTYLYHYNNQYKWIFNKLCTKSLHFISNLYFRPNVLIIDVQRRTRKKHIIIHHITHICFTKRIIICVSAMLDHHIILFIILWFQKIVLTSHDELFIKLVYGKHIFIIYMWFLFHNIYNTKPSKTKINTLVRSLVSNQNNYENNVFSILLIYTDFKIQKPVLQNSYSVKNIITKFRICQKI